MRIILNMYLSSLLLSAVMLMAAPISRYECNTNNIFNIVGKASTSKQEVVLIVRDNINLGGRKLTVPPTAEIVIDGGSFSNGSIIGNQTTISAGAYPIFDNSISISGTWAVDEAYAEWFGITGTSDDTEKIQKCLDSFYKCKLLNKYYNVTSIYIPDNASLEGNNQRRYHMPTLNQIESYKGDLISTGNKAYSGVSLSGFRIIGGNEENTAIRVSVPNSRIKGIFCDEYLGNGMNLEQRAWGTKIHGCSVFGNRVNAKTRKSIGTAILVNTEGGLISIEDCDINYYQTGVHLMKGVQVCIRNCNISDCSQNHFKKTDACIKISEGENIEIINNYIENFSTAIALVSGKQVLIQNNYINGLSVASFGIDVKGGVESVYVQNNHIYMGYRGAWAVALRSSEVENRQIRLSGNDLEESKLYKIEIQK